MHNIRIRNKAAVTLLSLFCIACSDSSDRTTPPPVSPPVENTQEPAWRDEDTGLYWQLRNKGDSDPDFIGIIPAQAHAYCEELEAGGYGDWRLATANIRGITNPCRRQPGGGSRWRLQGGHSWRRHQ